MRKYFLPLALTATVFFGFGCLDYNQAPRQIQNIPTILVEAEPAIREVENVTGATLSAETINKGEKVARSVEKWTERLGVAAGIASSAPTPASPFLATGAAILGALGTVAGGVASFFARRRARRLEMGLDAVVVAVDNEPAIGAKIAIVTKARGVFDVVEARYLANRVN